VRWRQRERAWRSDPGAPWGEEQGKAFGRALHAAGVAARPRTPGRNIVRLVEGAEVHVRQPVVEASAEVVQGLPSGLTVTDRRRDARGAQSG
jgi:hypothetical protein